MPVLRTSPVLALVSLLAVPACAVDDDAVQTDVVEQAAISGCGEPFCGNTPKLGDFPVFELDQTSTSFSKIGGLRIAGFYDSSGHKLRPVVSGFELSAIRLFDHAKLVGAALDNSSLVIETDTKPSRHFLLTIQTAAGVPYYENGDDGTYRPTYRITYVDVDSLPNAVPRDLCPGSDDIPYESLVFAGDRYDAYTGDVIATGNAVGPWFNIACKDDARWKLALMRYVEAAQDATHHNTATQREAGLRSIRADYCGNGIAMTELGTAIDWNSTGGWLELDALNEPIEAIWTDSGAFCISNPRFVQYKEIPCPRPNCKNLVGPWSSYGTWITYLP